jgi:hypothetical protein
MPSLAVIKSPPEPDHLASLLEQSDAQGAELERLRRFDVVVAEAQERLDQAAAELAVLVSQERAGLSEWATKGAHGSAPVMEHAARQAIEQRRALALGDLAAAIRQQEAVQGKVAKINAELGKLGREIYSAKLERVLDELPEIERKILDAHKVMASNLTQLRGLFDALSQEKSAADNRHDEASAALIQNAMGKIEAMRQPQGAPTWGEVRAAAATWRGRFR